MEDLIDDLVIVDNGPRAVHVVRVWIVVGDDDALSNVTRGRSGVDGWGCRRGLIVAKLGVCDLGLTCAHV